MTVGEKGLVGVYDISDYNGIKLRLSTQLESVDSQITAFDINTSRVLIGC